MFQSILNFIASGLIETMFVGLTLALFIRYMSYRQSKYDSVFFQTFVRGVNKKIQKDSSDGIKVNDPDRYINQMLEEIEKQLPNRMLRGFGRKKSSVDKKRFQGAAEVVSLREYASGNHSLIHSLKNEINVFTSHHPPSFSELTRRIMGRDEHWMKLFGLFKINTLSRLLDVTPGIFVVVGIFGTFVGISMALPQIANIDFDKIQDSSEVLGSFVLDVTFAMKTSIAGIGCSLILSFLNALSPINVVRKDISMQVEHCLERLWFYVQGEDDKEENQNQSHIEEKQALIEQNRQLQEKLISVLDRLNENLEKTEARETAAAAKKVKKPVRKAA